MGKPAISATREKEEIKRGQGPTFSFIGMTQMTSRPQTKTYLSMDPPTHSQWWLKACGPNLLYRGLWRVLQILIIAPALFIPGLMHTRSITQHLYLWNQKACSLLLCLNFSSDISDIYVNSKEMGTYTSMY